MLRENSFDLRAAPDSGEAPFLGDYIGMDTSGSEVLIAFPVPGDRSDPFSIYFTTVKPAGKR